MVSLLQALYRLQCKECCSHDKALEVVRKVNRLRIQRKSQRFLIEFYNRIQRELAYIYLRLPRRRAPRWQVAMEICPRQVAFHASLRRMDFGSKFQLKRLNGCFHVVPRSRSEPFEPPFEGFF